MVLVLLPTLVGTPAPATGRGLSPPAPPAFDHELLAKATPDECFVGIGLPYPAGPPCAQGQAKVNQAYVWSLAKADNRLWFGTGANVNCIVTGATLSLPTPRMTDDYVCEFAESQVVKQNPTMPVSVGDHRQPRAFVYDLSAGALTEKTSDITSASPDDLSRLRRTLGLRAGGTHQGVVLLAGPALGATVNMFAFDTATGEYLGSANFTKYGNIRHFLVADDALYAGVGVGPNGRDGGYILRWAGDRDDPFNFVEVGQLPAQVADLESHDGRVFVSTWSAAGGSSSAAAATRPDPDAVPVHVGVVPTDQADPGIAGVWMSPRLRDGEPGLTAEDSGQWTQVWSAASYEPDPIIAGSYGLGALASYGGYLYWGTMHVPMKSTAMVAEAYPPMNETAARTTLERSQRAVSIFRGRRFGTALENTELLYGQAVLPAYNPTADYGVGAWQWALTGYRPKYGRMGFGNIYNNYTWTMAVSDGKLFVGTMDWSYLAKDLLPQAALEMGFRGAATRLSDGLNPITIDPELYGGDLWMFDSTRRRATAVNAQGLGNNLNYGYRTMVADGSTLYLGMANPMNLRTDPTDDVPEGGWELIRLTPAGG
ncbi:hypothetical protein [Micromonospora sp. LOL_023]|uniref:hypothetical protein n=1 Tax=Micromonospora sp. LOL_023 TaxID=3345418 RepID=UPI003A8783B5